MLALGMLLSAGCSDPVGDRIASLQEGDSKTRLRAIVWLKRQPANDSRIASVLAEATHDEEGFVRCAALKGLGGLGEGASPHLPRIDAALEDPDAEVRLAAALASKAIDANRKQGEDVIQAALLAGQSEAFLGVGRLREKSGWAVPILADLASSKELRIRLIAIRTLGQLGSTAQDASHILSTALSDPRTADQAQAALDRLAGNDR